MTTPTIGRAGEIVPTWLTADDNEGWVARLKHLKEFSSIGDTFTDGQILIYRASESSFVLETGGGGGGGGGGVTYTFDFDTGTGVLTETPSSGAAQSQTLDDRYLSQDAINTLLDHLLLGALDALPESDLDDELLFVAGTSPPLDGVNFTLGTVGISGDNATTWPGYGQGPVTTVANPAGYPTGWTWSAAGSIEEGYDPPDGLAAIYGVPAGGSQVADEVHVEFAYRAPHGGSAHAGRQALTTLYIDETAYTVTDSVGVDSGVWAAPGYTDRQMVRYRFAAPEIIAQSPGETEFLIDFEFANGSRAYGKVRQAFQYAPTVVLDRAVSQIPAMDATAADAIRLVGITEPSNSGVDLTCAGLGALNATRYSGPLAQRTAYGYGAAPVSTTMQDGSGHVLFTDLQAGGTFADTDGTAVTPPDGLAAVLFFAEGAHDDLGWALFDADSIADNPPLTILVNGHELRLNPQDRPSDGWHNGTQKQNFSFQGYADKADVYGGDGTVIRINFLMSDGSYYFDAVHARALARQVSLGDDMHVVGRDIVIDSSRAIPQTRVSNDGRVVGITAIQDYIAAQITSDAAPAIEYTELYDHDSTIYDVSSWPEHGFHDNVADWDLLASSGLTAAQILDFDFLLFEAEIVASSGGDVSGVMSWGTHPNLPVIMWRCENDENEFSFLGNFSFACDGHDGRIAKFYWRYASANIGAANGLPAQTPGILRTSISESGGDIHLRDIHIRGGKIQGRVGPTGASGRGVIIFYQWGDTTTPTNPTPSPTVEYSASQILAYGWRTSPGSPVGSANILYGLTLQYGDDITPVHYIALSIERFSGPAGPTGPAGPVGRGLTGHFVTTTRAGVMVHEPTGATITPTSTAEQGGYYAVGDFATADTPKDAGDALPALVGYSVVSVDQPGVSGESGSWNASWTDLGAGWDDDLVAITLYVSGRSDLLDISNIASSSVTVTDGYQGRAIQITAGDADYADDFAHALATQPQQPISAEMSYVWFQEHDGRRWLRYMSGGRADWLHAVTITTFAGHDIVYIPDTSYTAPNNRYSVYDPEPDHRSRQIRNGVSGVVQTSDLVWGNVGDPDAGISTADHNGLPTRLVIPTAGVWRLRGQLVGVTSGEATGIAGNAIAGSFAFEWYRQSGAGAPVLQEHALMTASEQRLLAFDYAPEIYIRCEAADHIFCNVVGVGASLAGQPLSTTITLDTDSWITLTRYEDLSEQEQDVGRAWRLAYSGEIAIDAPGASSTSLTTNLTGLNFQPGDFADMMVRMRYSLTSQGYDNTWHTYHELPTREWLMRDQNATGQALSVFVHKIGMTVSGATAHFRGFNNPAGDLVTGAYLRFATNDAGRLTEAHTWRVRAYNPDIRMAVDRIYVR